MKWIWLGASCALCSGCLTVGPDYRRPDTGLADRFKNAGERGEAISMPERGEWWKAFDDQALNVLMEKCATANPSLAAAVARRDQAHAALGGVTSELWPRVTGTARGVRKRDSQNEGPFQIAEGEYETYRTALNLDYEIDLWGKVRRQIEGSRARLEAAEGTLDDVQLSLRAELARVYFSLRSVDAELRLIERSRDLRKESLELLRTRERAGEISQVDVARAEAELQSIHADSAVVRRQREGLVNALAALSGVTPSAFEMGAAAQGLGEPPRVPASTPSVLLGRRADVRASEAALAEASADIGVVKASFLPSIQLTGAGGVRSLTSSDLFKPTSRWWEIGPQIDVPVFSGGRVGSALKESRARFAEAMGHYQESLLTAVREVEDALYATRSLDDELNSRRKASIAARKAEALSRERYERGLDSYLEWLDAQRTALSTERLETRVHGERFQATVTLIQALGGQWDAK